MQNLKYYIKHPNDTITAIFIRLFNWLPDKLYLRILFFLYIGKAINLKNPITFSEKLQWLKLYNYKPEYTKMVDKYAAKQYVASKIGIEHIIPTLGVWNRPEDIDFETLPDKFVLKTTHDCGGSGIIICKDKKKLDTKETIKKLNHSLKRDISKTTREWPYKNVPHRIIAEKYMEEDFADLRDYKFFCFCGNPVYCQVISNKGANKCIDFFDMNWKLQPFTGLHSPHTPQFPHNTIEPQKPISFEFMKQACKILSEKIPFIRIDFYETGGIMYFGELTFFPASGFGVFSPNEWNKKLGDLLTIPL